MAKEDNPKQYKTLFNKNKENIIELVTADDGVLNDLEAAQKVYSLYKHFFVMKLYLCLMINLDYGLLPKL